MSKAEFSVTVKGPNGTIVFQRFAAVDQGIDEAEVEGRILNTAADILDIAIRQRAAHRRQ